MDMNQYLEIFIEESQEHLQSLNQCLLGLESNPNDMKLLNEIFRVAHTLKGMAGTMGYTKITSLTHEMENVLDLIRNGKVIVTSNIVDVLFECLDYLENSINNISSLGSELDTNIDDTKNKLKGIINGKPQNELKTIEVVKEELSSLSFNQYDRNVIFKANQQGLIALSIRVFLAKSCMLKSARAFIIFKTLESYAEIFKSSPKVEDIEDEKFEYSFELAAVTSERIETIKKDLEDISEVELVEVNIVNIENIDNKEKQNELNNVNEELEDIIIQTTKIEIDDKNSSNDTQNKKAKIGKTVRVDIDRLDNLMNLVSELIIIKTRLEGIGTNSSDQDMNEAVEYLERITTSLHDAVMKVRMVPIEKVFNRFPRMVRDLSKDLGKEIILNMSGEETELDRTVIDEIGDPLIHLIRNSIDHGIEETTERIQNNKNSTGNLYLRAYQDGNSVVIEVEDDGKGLNIDKIKKKALEKGIISKQDWSDLDDKNSIELIFRPGFSTAEIVSDISGRGVGLDVVKTKIESLGGTVEIETAKNKGSKFIIRLPLTLAIIQALLVKVGEEKFAIPLNAIKEITPISASTIRNVQGQEVVLYRNNVLPIIRLEKILEVSRGANQINDELTTVVVKKGDKNAGFIVDSLIGQQEIVIKSLGKYLSGSAKIIAGATILGDGQVALIIDSNSLI